MDGQVLARKVYLLKSVLIVLPLFYLSLFKLLTKVGPKCKVHFCRDGGRKLKKIVWVKWKNVCKPNEEKI